MKRKSLRGTGPKLCYGCGTCVGTCVNDAIAMRLDKEKGIFLPKVDNAKCDNCGLCTQVCPWVSLDKAMLDAFICGKRSNNILRNHLGCYTGYSRNTELTSGTSSGGLVSTLLTFALEEGIIDGALVTRFSEKEPLNPQPFIARTKHEIMDAGGSKYFPIPANIALKEIMEEKGKFAVVGLPCHIQGVRKAERIIKKLNERIVLHVGLFCSGTISSLGTDILLRSLNVDAENISMVRYREGGWPGGFRAHLKDGTKTQLIPYEHYFSIVRFYLPLSCFACWDALNEFSDISFGDAWIESPQHSRRKETSIAISRTEKGDALLKAAASKERIMLKSISLNRVLHAQEKSTSFKHRNLALRRALTKIASNENPDFRNVGYSQNLGRSSASTIKALLLFSRCALMSNRATGNILNPFLLWSLKRRVTK